MLHQRRGPVGAPAVNVGRNAMHVGGAFGLEGAAEEIRYDSGDVAVAFAQTYLT